MRPSLALNAFAWIGALTLVALCPGCASNGPPNAVPQNARLVARHGGTDDVVFMAPRDGEVFIYDRTAHKLIYSGRIRQGESVKVDAKNDKIAIDNRVVSED